VSKTRTQLINRALQRLGVIGENRPPFPNETAVVDDGVEPLIGELQQREIIFVGDPDNIDDAVYESLAVCLADAVKGFFGVAALPLEADGTAPVLRAETKLRQIGYGRYSGAVQQGEYM
jgi:hypothetical protein